MATAESRSSPYENALLERGITRKYESEELVNQWETLDPEQLKQCLAQWMRDMKAWGLRVKRDIIRLEGAVRMAAGEPGDPPPAPRVK